MSENTSDRRRRRKPQFNPGRLFANGEEGAWYDPSDFSTLYQDSAGTTPVTALGQPVGLMLDKSQGAAPGPELVTNGDFATGDLTGWTVVGTDPTHYVVYSNGGARYVSDTSSPVLYLRQNGILTIGKTYEVSITTTNYVSGTLKTDDFSGSRIVSSGAGTVRFIAKASASNLNIYRNSADVDITLDNISVREIPGNHASQSTSTARPTVQARANFAEPSQISAGTGTSVTSNVATAPDGTLSAQRITKTDATTPRYVAQGYVSSFVVGSENYVASRYFKYDGVDTTVSLEYNSSGNFGGVVWVAVFDVAATGVTVASQSDCVASVENVGDGWYRCSAQLTTGATITSPGTQYLTRITGASGVSVLTFGGQLERGSTATTYQRVTTATDYEDIGLPRYLEFDGVDDAMSTASVDFSASDEMNVFAGVERLSGASVEVLAELGPASTGSGSFGLFARNVTNDWRYRSTGSVSVDTTYNDANNISKRVISGISDISTPDIKLRSDGEIISQSSASQGTGNYINNSLYIAARAASSFHFTGRIHQLIIRGATTSGALLDATERFVANKTGVTL